MEFLQDFFDKSDRLFESAVTKCTTIEIKTTSRFEAVIRRPFSDFDPAAENVLSRQELETVRLSRPGKNVEPIVAAGTCFASGSHRLRVASVHEQD
jgi:hypothetical protein